MVCSYFISFYIKIHPGIQERITKTSQKLKFAIYLDEKYSARKKVKFRISGSTDFRPISTIHSPSRLKIFLHGDISDPVQSSVLRTELPVAPEKK